MYKRQTLMSALGQKQTDAAQGLLPDKNADFKGKHILLVAFVRSRKW